MPKGKPTKEKPCIVCTKLFLPTNGANKYCSKMCKRIVARQDGNAESTERQYELISGNWEKYFGRLCNKSLRREQITKHDCVELLKSKAINALCQELK